MCQCRCGSSFEVAVVSPQFEGKALLQRHRMVCSVSHTAQKLLLGSTACFCRGAKHALYPQVNTVLAEELRTIHAMAIKKVLTPEQQAALQPQK